MSVLDAIVDRVRQDLEERMARRPLAELSAALDQAPAVRDPMPAFRAPGVSIIAEVKRASPSKGQLAPIGDPAALASQYAAGGAAAISVLTEKHRFGGSLDDLIAVRDRVTIPVQRKDFIVTEYQLVEARVAGADMALLIVASLDDHALRDLLACTRELGLTALVEVHDEEELERAVTAGAELLGVNNRNLKTLEVNQAVFTRLAPLVPDSCVAVAESGISTPEDLRRIRDEGARVALIGEALVTHGDPARRIADLIAAGAADQ